MLERIYPLVIGAATIAASAAAPVLGQTADSTIAKAPELEEITVTAQKREANLQKVPIAISAFTEKTMEMMQIQDLSTLVEAVPGLQYSFANSNPQFTMRGINNYSNGPWVESAINVYVDGVYMGNNQASGFNFNNIQRVEVLKGPQGTLFGRNALGGVVNITTKDPQQKPSADLEVGYGNFDTSSASFYGTTGITDNLAADLSLYGENQNDGWGTNFYDNTELHSGWEWAARTKWLWTPSDGTRITVSGDYDRNDPPILGASALKGVYSFVPIGPPHVGGFWDSYLPDPGVLDIVMYGGHITIEHDFSWATLVSISAKEGSKVSKNATQPANPPFNPANPRQGQVAGFSYNQFQEVHGGTFTEELQLKSPASSSINWIVGAFFLDDNVDNYAIRAPVDAALRYTLADQKTKSYAGFAQATFPIVESTRLTLGARYTSERKTVDGNTYTAAGVVIPAQSVGANPEPSKKWQEPTYTVILDHDITDRVMAYGSYSRGFQSGTYNISSSVNSGPLDPQILDAFEVGLKSSWLQQTLRANASAFYYKMHDLLVSQNIDGVRLMSNAASAKYQGVDLDLTYLPIDRLTVTAGLSYVDPKYTDYHDATFYKANLATGVWGVTQGDATDNQITYSEKVSGTLSANYDFETAIGAVAVNGSWNYHSGTHFDSQNLLVQPSYSLFDAFARWTSTGGHWNLKLWGKNLTNKEYASTLFANTPVMYLNPAPPRTYGITVGYHFF